MSINKVQAWTGILLLVALILWNLKILTDDIKLRFNHKFTIGTTIGLKRTGNGPFVYYIFSVKDISYENGNTLGRYSPKTQGGRYYVKFLIDNPEVSEILWDMVVPDHITKAPLDGWDKIPH